ncbi:hypothetical protein HCN44_007377 [Aphidius gifuensis]|uniref:RING-type domain-containing protein n=1 Tax=Aphidius gifuensis TaxID=684658 RepID=A0A834XLH5_APHGI|nr:E3 ubiquitin-protein ligase rififylin isoform X2 [Aphidius gifuensis]KAF7989067.1 hypothetical protein HCN44_007377 [Aphidius gifuensis]
MDNELTYKAILHSIIPNKLFDDMACESCSTKFTLFKRKKQCKDCLRYYCADCVIRRGDRVLSCDNCSMLSRRPLIKSQVLKMKTKDLKQYLIAKKVSLSGCVEKEDLVNILMQYANYGEPVVNNERQEPNINTQQTTNRPNINENNTSPRTQSPLIIPPSTPPPTPPTAPPTNPIVIEEVIESSEREIPSPELHETSDEGFMIVELPDEDPTITTTTTTTAESSSEITTTNNHNDPEPVITEQTNESDTEISNNNLPNDSNEARLSTPIVTEIPVITGNVKLTNIAERSHLDYLNIKQLKDLLRTNRVDYRGCVERSELLDRAGRLWDDHKSSRDEATFVETQTDDGLCKICWDSPIECVILECGHMACCIECGKQMNECPICRQYVVRVVRFFKA